MNILIDAHVFDGKFQGTRTYLEGLYKEMVKHTDIDFFFVASKLDIIKSIFGNASNIHYIQLKTESKFKRLLFELPKIIKDNKIDYAHYQYISPIFKKCKEIVTVHDLLFLDLPELFPLSYRIKNGFFFWRSAKRADLLLTVSEFSKGEIEQHFKIDKAKIHITYNSILPSNINSNIVNLRSIYGLEKYILAVSRIEPRKNHLALLKAYVDLRLFVKGYKLVLVGSKDLSYKFFFQYYNSLTNEIKKNVLFLQVPFDHLVALYKNTSLFVFPSFAEGFGIPPLEALAYGCPLLCSDTTAMKEFGFPEDVFFNPRNQKELEIKIEKQLSNPSDLNEIRKEIFEKYNWYAIADNFYNLLISQGETK